MNIKHYILALAAMMTLGSCSSFLEEYSQDHDYVRSWKDLNELLLGDCYMPVNNSDYFKNEANVGTFVHLLSDEVDECSSTATNSFTGYGVHHYQFGYLTWQSRVGVDELFTTYYTENNTWTKMYKYINVANNVLASVEEVPQRTEDEIAGVNYVKGQAHFLRGWYYFWLTNMYGQPYEESTAATALGVPVKTSKEVMDVKFTRNTVQECYDLIVEDLLAAEKELTAARSISRKSTYRADSVSVQMLLSRVYLYMQNWEMAAKYAQKVIKRYGDLQNLNRDNSYFAAIDNPETIFTMGGDDMPVLLYYGTQSVQMTNEVYDWFADNDLRKSQWVWHMGDFTGITKADPALCSWGAGYTKDSPSYYNMKYSQSIGYQREVSSLFWLRSGEAYLNLAEAEAYMGHEEAARNAINTLRENRYISGASDMQITSSGSQLITDIRDERKRELLGEGHRWFDLRRYRVCKVQPEKISITHHFSVYQSDTSSDAPLETRTYVLPEDDPSWTMPIPQEVINFNTGMPNNGNVTRQPVSTSAEE